MRTAACRYGYANTRRAPSEPAETSNRNTLLVLAFSAPSEFPQQNFSNIKYTIPHFAFRKNPKQIQIPVRIPHPAFRTEPRRSTSTSAGHVKEAKGATANAKNAGSCETPYSVLSTFDHDGSVASPRLLL